MAKIKFIKGVPSAFRGICYAVSTEQNLKIQLFIALIVIFAAILLRIPKLHILIILIVTFFSVILELLNTAVEKLIDKLSPHYDKDYGKIKDIVGGVALLGAILSVIIGIVILFWPLFQTLWSLITQLK